VEVSFSNELWNSKPLLKMKQKFIWNNCCQQWPIAIQTKSCTEISNLKILCLPQKIPINSKLLISELEPAIEMTLQKLLKSAVFTILLLKLSKKIITKNAIFGHLVSFFSSCFQVLHLLMAKLTKLYTIKF